LIPLSVLTSSKFIDGCTSYKAEYFAYHENGAAQKLAFQCHKAKQNPEKKPAYFARQQSLKQYSGKLRLLFRNSHVDAKHKKSISDYKWLCDLDEPKGLTLGRTYRNINSCTTFIKYITKTAMDQVADEMKKA